MATEWCAVQHRCPLACVEWCVTYVWNGIMRMLQAFRRSGKALCC